MHPTAQRTALNLTAVREQWGDLLAAIERPPVVDWPPRETAGFLTRTDETEPLLVVDRAPLTLRQHPAPANLDALDAAVSVERRLFDLADTLAAAVQRPIRRWHAPTLSNPDARLEDAGDAADPRRWRYPSPTGPGSRAYGLHWAAVWCEGRVLGEDTAGDLFDVLPEHLLAEAAGIASRAAQRIERALGRDRRALTLDRPCPWCGGPLTGWTGPGGPAEAEVTCGTGTACTAPVLCDDRGRRRWAAYDLPSLYAALDAPARRTA